MTDATNQRLTGRVALVTGAGQGIGKAVARRLCDEGAHVVVADVRGQLAEAVAAELESHGASVEPATVDVAEREQVFSLVDDVAKRKGSLDIVVAAAQRFMPFVPLEEKTEEMFLSAFRSGALGTVWAMQAAFPYMKARGFGRFITFYSVNAEGGFHYTSDYNAAKGATESITRSAAREWGKYGITTNAISPAVSSDSFKNVKETAPDLAAAIEGSTLVGFLGEPEEVAATVAFLVSEEGRYITGETIAVAGGLQIGPSWWMPPEGLTEEDEFGHMVEPSSAPAGD
jgi:NAD(P)-dependent dehydrogenase (short-subunit alcohol dehydrogenase family)